MHASIFMGSGARGGMTVRSHFRGVHWAVVGSSENWAPADRSAPPCSPCSSCSSCSARNCHAKNCGAWAPATGPSANRPASNSDANRLP